MQVRLGTENMKTRPAHRNDLQHEVVPTDTIKNGNYYYTAFRIYVWMFTGQLFTRLLPKERFQASNLCRFETYSPDGIFGPEID